MLKYQIGCNYWACHAGTEMWKNWDAQAVEKDLKYLSETCGVRTLRMFPNWRDFQPIHKARQAAGDLREYCFADFQPLPNPEGLDPVQMEHFAEFCRLSEKYNLHLIVGLVTGWMSGMLFVPPALDGKNIINDPECLMWQNRFVQGFVRAFRDEKCIIAWDLGNECNNMGRAANRFEAYVWSMTIANAIRVQDQTRPVISGMHGLTPEGKPGPNPEGIWTFADQGELTDILTPHPYPSVFSKRDLEALNELTTTMYPTAQVLYYSGLGGRPAMIEETGTFNKMLGHDGLAADYLRMSLWSGLANGSAGTLWWCAFDQEKLDFPPYDWNMCENELGLMHSDYSLKDTGKAMAEFSETFDALKLDELPPRQVDACCILTRDQNQLLVNLSTTVLSKEAGFEVEYIYHNMPLPDRELYLLPSITGVTSLTVRRYRELLEKVRNGATLYISIEDGLVIDFENVFGARVTTRQKRRGPLPVKFDTPDGELNFTAGDGYELWLEPTTAEVLGRDSEERPVFIHNRYGKGHIYLLVMPIEKMLATRPGAFSDPGMPEYHRLYRTFSQPVRAKKIARSEVPQVVVTQHFSSENEATLLAVNYTSSALPLKLDVTDGWELELLHGAANGKVDHNNAAVLRAHRR